MADDAATLGRVAAELGELRQQLAAERQAHAATKATLNAALAAAQQQLADEQAAHETTNATLTAAAADAKSQAESAERSMLAANDALAAANTKLAELTAAKSQADSLARTQLAAANDALAAANIKLDAAKTLSDQVSELRAKYEGAPPQGSGIVQVTRWQTSDGTLHASLPEAHRAAAIAGIVSDLGVSHVIAMNLVDKRDRVRPHFSVADAADSNPRAES